MADEKEKKDDEGGKKSPLMPIILVGVGAALGGAGVVMMNPKPAHEKHAPKPREIVDVLHSEDYSITFNPRDGRQRVVRTRITFRYVVDKELATAAVKKVENGFEDARADISTYLRRQSWDELQDVSLDAVRKNQIKRILQRNFFPGDGVPILDSEGKPTGKTRAMATISRVNISEWIAQ